MFERGEHTPSFLGQALNTVLCIQQFIAETRDLRINFNNSPVHSFWSLSENALILQSERTIREAHYAREFYFAAAAIISRTLATASSGLTGVKAPPRVLISTSPLASDFSPIAMRMGMPMSSESLNFTPGRSSRSSRMTSTPLAVSSL